MQWQYIFQFVECALGAVRRVTLARFRCMLPDDGPEGPKHVGAIERYILGINCSILCF